MKIATGEIHVDKDTANYTVNYNLPSAPSVFIVYCCDASNEDLAINMILCATYVHTDYRIMSSSLVTLGSGTGSGGGVGTNEMTIKNVTSQSADIVGGTKLFKVGFSYKWFAICE